MGNEPYWVYDQDGIFLVRQDPLNLLKLEEARRNKVPNPEETMLASIYTERDDGGEINPFSVMVTIQKSIDFKDFWRYLEQAPNLNSGDRSRLTKIAKNLEITQMPILKDGVFLPMFLEYLPEEDYDSLQQF